MTWLKGLIAKLIGKNLKSDVDGKLAEWQVSKAKVAGILAVILPAVGPLSTALGHPIVIPDVVYKVLAGLGLWALRDAVPSATNA